MDKVYPTDVTDEQWALVEPLIPPAIHGGAPRTVNMRLVFNTILYINKTGCQWAMLPKDMAKRSTDEGLRTHHLVRRGDDQGVIDPPDAQSPTARPEHQSSQIHLSPPSHEKSGLTFRIDSKTCTIACLSVDTFLAIENN